MEPLEGIRRLAQTAQREAAPEVDVTFGVLRRIRRTSAPTRLAPLPVLSLASAVVAVVILAVGIYVWTAGADPMQALVPVEKVVALW